MFTTSKKKTKNPKLDTDPTLFTKINSKWIPDLNVKYTTENLPEYSIQEKLWCLLYILENTTFRHATMVKATKCQRKSFMK